MAIRCDGFEVIFSQRYGQSEQEIRVTDFFSDAQDSDRNREQSYIEVKENLGLTITFQADTEDAQFFMDGLETLPEQTLLYDSSYGEVYLSPSEKSVTLFDHTNEYYPLIPGYYRMTILYRNQRYYAWVKVLPKQLEVEQWETMKNEVEGELQGLAKEMQLRKTALNLDNQVLTNTLLEKFFVISHHFPKVMTALNDLYRRVSVQINKEYALVSKEKVRKIDEKTVRHALSSPQNELSFKVPISGVTYDLPENRLAKRIINVISRTLTIFIDEVETTQRQMRSSGNSPIHQNREETTLLELNRLAEDARKMRGSIQWIKTAPWYEYVRDHEETSIPFIMNSDSRYRALYQLYRALNNEQDKPKLETSYSFQWKRSDKLYEIWGYLQFIKVLIGKELGFSPESGWIFNDDVNAKKRINPDLPANTEVVFKKNNLRLHLVYEALLPTQSEKVTSKKLLYTRGTHTCPDGRLDLYQDDIYIGSIVVDFKYRPRNAIWNETDILKGKQNEVVRQLVSYGHHIYSLSLFALENPQLVSRISPIQEVWAIYPHRYGMSRVHDYPDHKVSLVELTPGKENEHFLEKIKTSIENLIQTSLYFRKL